MSRIRAFSIVFHNVKEDAKPSVEKYFECSKPKEILVSLEPYPESPGYHIHVFVSYTNAHFFKTMLEKCKTFSSTIVVEHPEGVQGDWGRVQVDKMRGNFKQATAYLVNPQKEKECDPDVTHRKKGDLVCDVCASIGTALDFGADYSSSLGRCRRCCLIPHRLLKNLGYQVRELPRLIFEN